MDYLPTDNIDRFVLCITGCTLIAFLIQTVRFKSPKLNIPRIGKSPSGLFGLANARADFLVNGRKLVEEGHKKASHPLILST